MWFSGSLIKCTCVLEKIRLRIFRSNKCNISLWWFFVNHCHNAFYYESSATYICSKYEIWDVLVLEKRKNLVSNMNLPEQGKLRTSCGEHGCVEIAASQK